MSEIEDTIGVLINNCYGGFKISEKALDLYNKKKSELDSNHKPITENCIDRDDPILVEIYNELQKDFNGANYSNIIVENIPKKYKKCYNIHNYDGQETILINLEKYKLDTIKMITSRIDLNSDEKINEINKVLLETLNNNFWDINHLHIVCH